MFKQVLIPTDLSQSSRRALDVGLELAGFYGGRATVLHVPSSIDRGSFFSTDVVQKIDDLLERESDRIEREARNEIDRHVRSGERTIPLDRIAYRVTAGVPSEVIVGTATDVGADLIVMGTHGREGVRQILLGSTAERVLRDADCSVFTVKPEGYPFVRD